MGLRFSVAKRNTPHEKKDSAMSHLTSTAARIAIVTVRKEGDRTVHLTEHWNGTYVEARVHIARYIASNGLHRVTYGDSACLLCDGTVIGHYTITRS